ncbi:hypothetical protein HPP92_013378 [Vanilla planifolia]|uniref:Uncharacterized protein n=1 Tax=Vanilla planifolia TaxID=51239 RepID=A0A835QXL0_VANPL|nr:hypothetical protein HPP92_013378 [Vanilla planifolia]
MFAQTRRGQQPRSFNGGGGRSRVILAWVCDISLGLRAEIEVPMCPASLNLSFTRLRRSHP